MMEKIRIPKWFLLCRFALDVNAIRGPVANAGKCDGSQVEVASDDSQRFVVECVSETGQAELPRLEERVKRL
jgi:hypothetical protein